MDSILTHQLFYFVEEEWLEDEVKRELKRQNGSQGRRGEFSNKGVNIEQKLVNHKKSYTEGEM